MSALVEKSTLTAEAARVLTDEVKADAAALWSKLLQLFEGGAHKALGYSSWGAYYEAEFNESGSRGRQLLAAARVIRALDAGPEVTNGNSSTTPPSERVARELVPVLREDPERVEEVWAEVVREHGPEPTASQVREHVKPRHNGNLAVHFSSATDQWATPQEFFDVIDREFAFDIDVCAFPSSAKCATYFTPTDDGLTQDWTGVCWMNPPYGDEIVKWVRKAFESARDNDATVVCLVPARVDTGWWWDYCRFGEIRFLRGRLKFGDAATSAPFPSTLVIFGPRPAKIVWWEWRSSPSRRPGCAAAGPAQDPMSSVYSNWHCGS